MFKRVLSMGLSLLLSVSTTAAMAAEALRESDAVEAVPPWIGEYRIAIRTDAQSLTLRLPDGSFVERLQVADAGEAVSSPLRPGQYLIEGDAGRTLVSLRENASVAVLDGMGWADGEIVHFSEEFAGTLHVICCGEPGDQHSFSLNGVEDTDKEIQFYTDEAIGLLFPGLAEGSYDLCMDGNVLRSIRVSPDQPVATVTVEKLKPQP